MHLQHEPLRRELVAWSPKLPKDQHVNSGRPMHAASGLRRFLLLRKSWRRVWKPAHSSSCPMQPDFGSHGQYDSDQALRACPRKMKAMEHRASRAVHCLQLCNWCVIIIRVCIRSKLPLDAGATCGLRQQQETSLIAHSEPDSTLHDVMLSLLRLRAAATQNVGSSNFVLNTSQHNSNVMHTKGGRGSVSQEHHAFHRLLYAGVL